jgi:MinD superfamily P-loop ATPase
LLTGTNPDGAILVTTPQEVSLNDVRKEISFCHKMKIPILGLVENMSGFACPCCNEITYIFSKGGGQLLCNEYDIDLLGSVPIDPKLAESEDEGVNFVKKFDGSTSANVLKEICIKIMTKTKMVVEKDTMNVE